MTAFLDFGHSMLDSSHTFLGAGLVYWEITLPKNGMLVHPKRFLSFTRPLILLNNSIMYGFSVTELI